MKTVGDICDEIYRLGADGRVPQKGRIPVTRGLTKRAAPTKPGLVQITPEQALSVIIEHVSVNGTVEGYQRKTNVGHARRIARALERGEDVGEVSLGLDGGRLLAPDGQHRLIGCVISRKPIWAVIRPMTTDARAKRFASQQQARRVSAEVLAMASSGAIQRYIQDAVVARKNGTDHAWAKLVGAHNSAYVMGPHVAVSALTNYTLGLRGSNHVNRVDEVRLNAAFNAKLGDELAQLLLTFGTKSTNPLAFRPSAVKAIADAAVLVIFKQGRKPQDIARWERHMASFDWSGYAWVKSQRELSLFLIRHWNKRLGLDKKISEV